MVWVFVSSWLTAEVAASVFIPSTFSGRGVNNGRDTSDRTYIKDLKNLVEVQPPSDNLFPVALCMETLRDHVSFILLDDIPFDLRHGSEAGREASPRGTKSVRG